MSTDDFERNEAGNLTDEGIRQYLQAKFNRVTKIKDDRIAELEAQLEEEFSRGVKEGLNQAADIVKSC